MYIEIYIQTPSLGFVRGRPISCKTNIVALFGLVKSPLHPYAWPMFDPKFSTAFKSLVSIHVRYKVFQKHGSRIMVGLSWFIYILAGYIPTISPIVYPHLFLDLLRSDQQSKAPRQ